MSLSLRKYFLLNILLFSCYLQENTFFAFANSSEDEINEKLTCSFEKNSLCNYQLIGAKERYNNGIDSEEQYLEIKMSETKEIFVESPMINVEENGHNFSFYHSYFSPNKKLNVYADDKLIYSYSEGYRIFFFSSWTEAKFELPVGKYKIRIQIPQLYWSRYKYTRLDSFAFDRNRIAEQLDCNFDNSYMCKYNVVRDSRLFMWMNQKYASPGLGSYLYVSPSDCKLFGNGLTYLTSPYFDVPEKGHFVSFYYYLDGFPGLKVEVLFDTYCQKNQILINPSMKNVPALNTWHKAKFDLSKCIYEYQMTIKSECLETGNGSIAIDSIAVDREPERPKYPPIWN